MIPWSEALLLALEIDPTPVARLLGFSDWERLAGGQWRCGEIGLRFAPESLRVELWQRATNHATFALARPVRKLTRWIAKRRAATRGGESFEIDTERDHEAPDEPKVPSPPEHLLVAVKSDVSVVVTRSYGAPEHRVLACRPCGSPEWITGSCESMARHLRDHHLDEGERVPEHLLVLLDATKRIVDLPIWSDAEFPLVEPSDVTVGPSPDDLVALVAAPREVAWFCWDCSLPDALEGALRPSDMLQHLDAHARHGHRVPGRLTRLLGAHVTPDEPGSC
jgi:hypothetical protein